jgi:heme oxygenase
MTGAEADMPRADQVRCGKRTGAVGRLRDATRSCHQQVDAAYSVFDLADRVDYGRFLLAHAQATGAAEASLSDDLELPPWRPRMPLLTDDLDRLGLVLPPALAFGPTQGGAWDWGVLYVLEGSRLGATIIVEQAGSHVPAEYLSSRHLAGEWRTLLQAIDRRGAIGGDGWIDAAVTGARACFGLYQSAARSMSS